MIFAIASKGDMGNFPVFKKIKALFDVGVKMEINLK